MNHRRSYLLSYACGAILSTASAAAVAQQPAASRTTELEEVVVTGTFIPTLPEDAAIPVEVINYEDIQDLGRPSNLDLIKTLTEVGQVVGELDRNNAYPIDAITINLRNVGARFTTVVFNNRRFPEQFSPAVGRFNNVASIPGAAIGNVEILRNGGAAIYGADAVAGVVNYITRKNVNGLELNADYRYIEDSDGDYNVDGIWGKTFDGGNFIVSGAYQHRNKLLGIDRDFGRYQYLENPEGWSALSSPGAYAFQLPVLGAQTQVTPHALTPLAARYTGQRHITAGTAATSGPLANTGSGTIRDPACTALGGFAGWNGTPSPVCYGSIRQFEPLVEESDSASLFAELNQRIGDSMQFHLEALVHYRNLPEIEVSTRAFPSSWPLDFSSITNGQFNRQQLPAALGSTAFYAVRGTNPAVGHFLSTMFLNQDNVTPSYGGLIPTITSTTNPGRAVLLNGLWVPFTIGGHPLGQGFDTQENTSNQYRLSASIGADLPSFLGTELEWEVAATYHYTKDVREVQDALVDRFQAALNGLGGPNCAAGSTPGSTGCFYFNPFSSAYARNIFTGAASPFFVGSGNFTGYVPGMGLQNNPDVVRWLYVPLRLERVYHNYIFDPIVRGSLGIELPGGPIKIAVGGQFRLQTEDTDVDDFSDEDRNPCPTLGVTNCVEAARTGVLVFGRNDGILGGDSDERRRFPVVAGFAEVQLPILDNLNVSAAGRYEKFYSDLTDKDNDTVVPAVSLKYSPTDWFSVRTSYGLTFSQVNPPRDDGPTINSATVAAGFVFGGSISFTTASYDNVDVKPEEGENFSIGFVLLQGDFRATVDYNAITVKNYTRTLTTGQVLAALVVPGSTRNQNALINCSSPLITGDPVAGLGGRRFVELSGPCNQGTSTLLTAFNGGRINFYGGAGQTNAGELISNAIDLTMSYDIHDVFGGDLTPAVDLTYITKWEFSDFVVAGINVARGYDGVGFRNQGTGRLGQGVPEYRASFGLRYRIQDHTINLQARYIPSLLNEDTGDFSAQNSRNANIGPVTTCPGATGSLISNIGNVPAGAGSGEFGTFCAAQNTATLAGDKIEEYINLDLIYRMSVTDNLSMTLTINNLLDEDPSFARDQLGYDAGFGSPLGRTFRLGASMRF